MNPVPELQIAALDAFPVREPVSRRSYTILRLRTRSGLAGYGECPEAAPRDLAKVSEAVRGLEATLFETIRYRLAAPPGLMAGLNMAMLDLVGRYTKAPVYQILGGPTRNKVRALAPLHGAGDAELAASARRAREAGFRAFLVPAPKGTETNHGKSFALQFHRRLEAVREAAADGTDFVLDGAGSLSPGDASFIAAEFERFHLLWFDEPCAFSNLQAIRKINQTVTPVGYGRFAARAGAFQDLLREDAVDVVRPDLAVHGISGIRRIAAIAENYYVAAAPYHDGGPVASAAALQLAASLPNFFIQQFPLPAADEDRRMREALTDRPVEVVRDGFGELPTGPGLGFTINEQALRKYRERAA